MKNVVTLSLLVISIVIQIAISLYPPLLDVLALNPTLQPLLPLQLLTHMLSHANWDHLIGNFCFGLPFMAFLERRMGSKRFLAHYMLCGAGSLGVFLLMSSPGAGIVGSSGAIMGAAIGACLAFGDNKAEHVAGVAMALCLLLPQLAMAPLQDIIGVAVWGHVGGALTAMLLAARAMQQPRV